jgi:hypothetical protein
MTKEEEHEMCENIVERLVFKWIGYPTLTT